MQRKCVFKGFEASNAFKCFWSQSLKDWHGTSLLEGWCIAHCCEICSGRSQCAQALLYPLPRQVQFRSTNKLGTISADSPQLCMSRSSCNIGHHNRNRSRGPHILSQFSVGREIHSSGCFEMHPFNPDRDLHWPYFAEVLGGVHGSCSGCQSCSACKFGFSLHFGSFLKGTIPHTEKSETSKCTSWEVTQWPAYKENHLQEGWCGLCGVEKT